MAKKKDKKTKKEKVRYIDDGSTVVDMDVEGFKWHDKKPTAEKRKSTHRERARTFFSTMKMMVLPMLVTLLAFTLVYLLMQWIL